VDIQNMQLWPHGSPDPWADPSPADPRGGSAYAEHLESVRTLQDLLAGAVVSDDQAAEIADLIGTLSDRLRTLQQPEPGRRDGMRPDLPGRGHPMLPAYRVEQEDEVSMRGSVRFSRFYLGGRAAAHGGSHALLFDDVLGRMANYSQEGVARTAYLHVNYRKIVPMDVDLSFEATLDRIDGRKRWTTGRLRDPDGIVLADAEGLYVELRTQF